jgi:integrase
MDPVFANRDGGRQTTHNVARRLKTAVSAANVKLAESGLDPIGEALTPHSLRRLYASLRAALRDDPVYIAEQGGWTDPAFALRVYAKAARRRERLSGTALREFDRAIEWAEMGRNGSDGNPVIVAAALRRAEETQATSPRLTDAPG